MGIIRMGIPEEIAIFLKEINGINSFIETGTYKGGTAIWASNHFDSVNTIEFSEDIFEETKSRFQNYKNINFHFGDSRQLLEKILPDIQQSIIWLDAHWCSNGSYGENDQCPLIKELELINKYDKNHIILIDDARLFLAPPPLPNSVKYYPDLNQIHSTLLQHRRLIYIYEDVFIAIPESNIQKFQEFLQKKATVSWMNYGKKIKMEEELNRSRIKKTIYFLKRLIRTWV